MQSSEVIDAFVDAMHHAGVIPVEPIEDKLASGERFYFRAEGDKAIPAEGLGRPAPR